MTLTSTPKAYETREQLRYTVENAQAVPGGTGTVIPFIALGAGYHSYADLNLDLFQGMGGSRPFLHSAFDFTGALDGGYPRTYSATLGAQVNLPMFNSTGRWRHFGPWDKVVAAVFYPSVLDPRSAPCPGRGADWALGSSVLLDHFISYVRGANACPETGAQAGTFPCDASDVDAL